MVVEHETPSQGTVSRSSVTGASDKHPNVVGTEDDDVGTKAAADRATTDRRRGVENDNHNHHYDLTTTTNNKNKNKNDQTMNDEEPVGGLTSDNDVVQKTDPTATETDHPKDPNNDEVTENEHDDADQPLLPLESNEPKQQQQPSSSSSSTFSPFINMLIRSLSLSHLCDLLGCDETHVRTILPHIALPAGGLFLAMLLTSAGRTVLFWWLWYPGYTLVCQTIGTALGVGLGLGLATHVYDFLTELAVKEEEEQEQRRQRRQREQNQQNAAATTTTAGEMTFSGNHGIAEGGGGGLLLRASSSRYAYPKGTGSTAALSYMEDENTYTSLMQSAGYDPVDRKQKFLRGHVLRREDAFFTIRYPFLSGSNNDNNNNDNNNSSNNNNDSSNKPPFLESSKALRIMQELWPVLPTPINEQLSLFMELIIRDYVASWYSRMDGGCLYEEEAAKRQRLARQLADEAASGSEQGRQETTATAPSSPPPPPRAMIYQLAPYRPLPLLDTLYETMAIVFGNLATRVEHVNLLHIVLLKWTRVLAYTFKTYRQLRKSVVTKQLSHHAAVVRGGAGAGAHAQSTSSSASMSMRKSGSLRSSLSQASAAVAATAVSAASSVAERVSSSGSTKSDSAIAAAAAAAASVAPPHAAASDAPSEMAMTKEFLFSNKLHRAITFGLDVPSLLFADATGKECGRPVAPPANQGPQARPRDVPVDDNSGTTYTDDDILEDRLFRTNLLYECELDYNRVVAHRIVRALLPRPDFNSPIVSKLLTEMMAGCVLSPAMSCACPSYFNNFLIRMLEKKEETTEDVTAAAAAAKDIGVLSDLTEENVARMAEGSSTPNAMGIIHEEGENNLAESSRIDNSLLIADDDARSTDTDMLKDLLESPEKAPQPGMEGMELSSVAGDDTVLTVDNTSLATPSTQPVVAASSGPDSADMAIAAKAAQTVAASNNASSDNMITHLALSLIELQRFADFEDLRSAREENRALSVDWDAPACRTAILRLVLVIEAALTNGRCTYRAVAKHESFDLDDEDDDEGGGEEDEGEEQVESERPVEVTLPEYESTTLSQILMELTSDIEAFEKRVATENAIAAENTIDRFQDMHPEPYIPTSQEQSTVRTLIAAWMHTGQLYRTVSVLIQAHATILAPYYRKDAFLRSQANAAGFVRQLRSLDGVEVMVDTMAVLASPRLDEANNEDIDALIVKSTRSPAPASSSTVQGEVASPSATASASILATQYLSASATPRFLDFHRNEAFAGSLRAERDRRMQSWETLVQDDTEEANVICRTKGANESEQLLHRELHYLARIFYNGTNLIAIRDAARRKTSSDVVDGTGSQSVTSEPEGIPVELLTVETVSPRRRIEIPDDDSSFLLRAQVGTKTRVHFHSIRLVTTNLTTSLLSLAC